MAYTHRFKTEEEMVATLGTEWRSNINCGWCDDMDSFFGQVLESEEIPTNNNIVSSYRSRYSISGDMVIPVNEKVAQELLDASKKVQQLINSINSEFISGCHRINYKPSYGYGFTFYIYPEPTANCQLASIANFDNVLSRYEGIELKNMLHAAVAKCGISKRLFFVDVNQSYKERLKPLASYSAITDYKSTNGSNMCYTIIKI